MSGRVFFTASIKSMGVGKSIRISTIPLVPFLTISMISLGGNGMNISWYEIRLVFK